MSGVSPLSGIVAKNEGSGFCWHWCTGPIALSTRGSWMNLNRPWRIPNGFPLWVDGNLASRLWQSVIIISPCCPTHEEHWGWGRIKTSMCLLSLMHSILLRICQGLMWSEVAWMGIRIKGFCSAALRLFQDSASKHIRHDWANIVLRWLSHHPKFSVYRCFSPLSLARSVRMDSRPFQFILLQDTLQSCRAI